MRWPEFLDWTPEERRAVLAVLLFTGGGGLLIELGRRFPDWTPDFRLVQSLDHHRVPSDSAAAGRGRAGSDSIAGGPGNSPDPAAPGGGAVGAREVGYAALGGGPLAGAGTAVDREDDSGRHRHRPPKADTPAGPVDLNRASAAELTRLPGVGPKLAERIVADRATRGPYRRVADLDRVKGVGPALLQKIAGTAFVGVASETTSSSGS